MCQHCPLHHDTLTEHELTDLVLKILDEHGPMCTQALYAKLCPDRSRTYTLRRSAPRGIRPAEEKITADLVKDVVIDLLDCGEVNFDLQHRWSRPT